MINASYYDGLTAQRRDVTLTLVADRWQLLGEQVSRAVSYADAVISEKLGKAPRQLHFNDGAYCVIIDHAGFEQLLAQAGYAPQSLVSRLEASWRYAMAALLLMVVFCVAAYQWGLPWFAQEAAKRIPADIALAIDHHALKTFDRWLMEPSKLTAARQQALSARLALLRLPGAQAMPRYTLGFRSSPAIGPNAFALPGGTIVLTDQLVKLADKNQAHDEEIIGVLAHELGHASERHALRQLLQGSIVAVVMTWYLGDVSSLLAAAPTALLQTRYSRDFERQADAYAANLLQANGISPLHLAQMLEKLENSQHEKNESPAKNKPQLGEYFSTHPETSKRIQALKEHYGNTQ